MAYNATKRAGIPVKKNNFVIQPLKYYAVTGLRRSTNIYIILFATIAISNFLRGFG